MVFEKLREIICEHLELELEEVTMESDLLEDFDADSMDLVDIAMSIEDEFVVEVPQENINNIRLVSEVVSFIEENM